MKTNSLLILSLLLSTLAFGQDKLIGFQISPGATITHVKDDRLEPSGGSPGNGYLVNPADGVTTNQGNKEAVGVAFTYQVGLNDKVHFRTGLGVMSKSILIGNQDGGYFGTSKYNIAYLQIPALAKIYFSEPADKVKLYFNLGLTLDLKVHEDLDKNYNGGRDGAHYWNLAKNLTHNDHDRGTNADHKSKALFAPLNVGIMGGVGLEYDLDKFILFGALNYNYGLLNTLNPGLRHNDINRTRITDGLSIKTDVFLVDIGIAFPVK